MRDRVEVTPERTVDTEDCIMGPSSHCDQCAPVHGMATHKYGANYPDGSIRKVSKARPRAPAEARRFHTGSRRRSAMRRAASHRPVIPNKTAGGSHGVLHSVKPQAPVIDSLAT